MKYLSLTNWKLACFWPFTPLQGSSMETGHVHEGLLGTIDAVVPGSVYNDLLRAGLIEDPYYEMNSLKCEWVKDRWWVYQTTFKVDSAMRSKQIRLVFKGIDYKAHIFLNGSHIADHEGMHMPCIIDITDQTLFGSELNSLKVVIEHAPDEMGQIGYTSRTHTTKARFTYKWDFGTRLVQLGLYDEVFIDVSGGLHIEDTAFTYADKTAAIAASASGSGRITARLSYRGDLVAEQTAEIADGQVRMSLPVEQPRLWYPNGSGEQPLYDLTLTAYDDNGLSDEKKLRVGLRTLDYRRANGAVENALPYLPVINGRRVYIKGVNCTPFDHLYGCVDEKRYRQMLTLAKEANVNLIRVWGGGLIEKEAFYDLCDELGIMVWQEFIQSSSGLENIPSKDPDFLRLTAAYAEEAVKEKRNHVSLTFWSGGNELFDNNIPTDFTDENLAMLKEITNRLDPGRLMLPTSASGPTEWFDEAHPENNQDIHGPWKYGGTEGHYRLYNRSTIQLHSEFGVDGMSNPEALRTILSPRNRRVTSMAENPVWRHHGEWWDTLYRDQEIFGNVGSLEEFITLSQFIQAEGLRYALEANRRRAWQNCGSIIWQFNEPWPNVSCTNLVDYYGQPKFAYYLCRDAYKPVHVSLQYDKLIWQADEMFYGDLFVHAEPGEKIDSVRVRILDSAGRTMLEKQASKAFQVSTAVALLGRSFTVECTLRAGNTIDVNRYLFFVLDDRYPKADAKAVIRYVTNYFKA